MSVVVSLTVDRIKRVEDHDRKAVVQARQQNRVSICNCGTVQTRLITRTAAEQVTDAMRPGTLHLMGQQRMRSRPSRLAN